MALTAPGSCFSCGYHRPGTWIECNPGQAPVKHYGGLCMNKKGEKSLCMVWTPESG